MSTATIATDFAHITSQLRADADRLGHGATDFCAGTLGAVRIDERQDRSTCVRRRRGVVRLP